MKATKGLLLHLSLLGIATVVAFASASMKKEPLEGKRVEAELVPGPVDAVRQITFESEDRKVNIIAAKDAVGRYGIVEVTRDATKPGASDAGVSLPKSRETRRFIAVDEFEKLIEYVAPAKSYRSLGKLAPDRLADYGLDKPEGKLSVKVGEKTYHLDIGALTPGSADYYVRDPESGMVNTYVADAVGRLRYGESRLIERDLHGFTTNDVKAVEIFANGKSRKLVRVEGKTNAWADASAPAAVDETAGNWLLKVQRLRPQDYVEKPTNIGPTPVVRIAYHDQKGKAGFLELYRCTDAEKKYLARSERSRWYVDIPTSSAEPIDQDVGTVVK